MVVVSSVRIAVDAEINGRCVRLTALYLAGPTSLHAPALASPCLLRMDSGEVTRFATALRTALRRGRQPIHLSRHACQAESFSILSVVNGLRSSCLLSALTASHTSLVALQGALDHARADHVLLVVHVASGQLFVLHRSLFVQRWTDEGRKDLFYAVEAGRPARQERVQVRVI